MRSESAYHTWGVRRFYLSYSRQLPRKHLTQSCFTTVSAPFRTHPYITYCLRQPCLKQFCSCNYELRLSYQQLYVLDAFFVKNRVYCDSQFPLRCHIPLLASQPSDHPPPSYCRYSLELAFPCARGGIKLTHRSQTLTLGRENSPVEKGVRKKGLVSESRMTTNNRVADYEKEGRR